MDVTHLFLLTMSLSWLGVAEQAAPGTGQVQLAKPVNFESKIGSAQGGVTSTMTLISNEPGQAKVKGVALVAGQLSLPIKLDLAQKGPLVVSFMGSVGSHKIHYEVIDNGNNGGVLRDRQNGREFIIVAKKEGGHVIYDPESNPGSDTLFWVTDDLEIQGDVFGEPLDGTAKVSEEDRENIKSFPAAFRWSLLVPIMAGVSPEIFSDLRTKFILVSNQLSKAMRLVPQYGDIEVSKSKDLLEYQKMFRDMLVRLRDNLSELAKEPSPRPLLESEREALLLMYQNYYLVLLQAMDEAALSREGKGKRFPLIGMKELKELIQLNDIQGDEPALREVVERVLKKEGGDESGYFFLELDEFVNNGIEAVAFMGLAKVKEKRLPSDPQLVAVMATLSTNNASKNVWTKVSDVEDSPLVVQAMSAMAESKIEDWDDYRVARKIKNPHAVKVVKSMVKHVADVDKTHIGVPDRILTYGVAVDDPKAAELMVEMAKAGITDSDDYRRAKEVKNEFSLFAGKAMVRNLVSSPSRGVPSSVLGQVVSVDSAFVAEIMAELAKKGITDGDEYRETRSINNVHAYDAALSLLKYSVESKSVGVFDQVWRHATKTDNRWAAEVMEVLAKAGVKNSDYFLVARRFDNSNASQAAKLVINRLDKNRWSVFKMLPDVSTTTQLERIEKLIKAEITSESDYRLAIKGN